MFRDRLLAPNGRFRSNFVVLAHNTVAAAHNGGREDCCPLKARLCVASGAFFCHVLRILLSEFNEDPNKPSLGIKERSHVVGMFVIIMSAEHDYRIDFGS